MLNGFFEQNLSPELKKKKKKFRLYIVKSKYPVINPTFMPSLISKSPTPTILNLSFPSNPIKAGVDLLNQSVVQMD